MTSPAMLPEDFRNMLHAASIDDLKALFKTLSVDARESPHRAPRHQPRRMP